MRGRNGEMGNGEWGMGRRQDQHGGLGSRSARWISGGIWLLVFVLGHFHGVRAERARFDWDGTARSHKLHRVLWFLQIVQLMHFRLRRG